MTAYLILDFSITDLPGFLPYADGIPAFIAAHGGRYIVRGVVPTVMEGDHARAFLADPDAQPLFALRHRTTDSKLILVEGCEDTDG